MNCCFMPAQHVILPCWRNVCVSVADMKKHLLHAGDAADYVASGDGILYSIILKCSMCRTKQKIYIYIYIASVTVENNMFSQPPQRTTI